MEYGDKGKHSQTGKSGTKAIDCTLDLGEAEFLLQLKGNNKTNYMTLRMNKDTTVIIPLSPVTWPNVTTPPY